MSLVQTLANPFDWGVLLRGAPAVPPLMAEFAQAAAADSSSQPQQQPAETPQPRTRRAKRRTAQVIFAGIVTSCELQ